ncbi:MAG: universal stress protein [Desulfobacterales bacterium]|nr:universal stress protein [Desulfobacterales bacterium]
MYRYKKLLVELKLNDLDSALIQYAGRVSRMAASSEINFVYISDSFDIPDEIKRLYPEISEPVDETAVRQMKERVEEHFAGHPDTRLTFEAVEGQMPAALISRVGKADIDLLIIGKVFDARFEDANLPEKIARKTPCSVLILPKNTSPDLSSVLVAVNFSEQCKNALDVGSAFAKAAGLEWLNLVSVCQVPTTYKKTGKSYAEFGKIMINDAKVKLRRFIPTADLKGLKISPSYAISRDVVKGIKRFADKQGARLVVIGARGRKGNLAAILLGSVTEGLIRTLEKPLLAVKQKGEGVGFFEALSSL